MMDNQNGIEKLAFAISAEEIAMAERSLESALKAGASGVQVSLDKARTDIYALLNGEIDNIRQTGDRALTFRIFADGKYGVFSTNRLDDRSIGHFMKHIVINQLTIQHALFQKNCVGTVVCRKNPIGKIFIRQKIFCVD